LTARAINELQQKYNNASLAIGSLCNELSVTTICLSQLQDLLVNDHLNPSSSHVRPELLATFDTALVGCMVVLSCIEEEIQGFRILESGIDSLTWRQRVKAVWNEDHIQKLVDQLHGQQLALNLLMQTVQM
jgi:hypothetical protein